MIYFFEKIETFVVFCRKNGNTFRNFPKKKLNIFHILLNKLKHILYFAEKSETLFTFCRKKITQLLRFGEKIETLLVFCQKKFVQFVENFVQFVEKT